MLIIKECPLWSGSLKFFSIFIYKISIQILKEREIETKVYNFKCLINEVIYHAFGACVKCERKDWSMIWNEPI